ncbi:actin-binding Rho-activating protein-like isoform X1 [Coccinella septempunctata]|uniref:actin-binding Rho-activating protein-like isoform X1 n=2 Tax=Coccinella septempunctata TaxID=41139 RepID=UPI001D087872|nr:actin-binding Rho-activating protein-like isoform X1 [Coccinella septempunctata]
MSACVNRVFVDSPLSSKVALFNAVANKHMQNQAINPFSQNNVVGSKPKISKEDYGKPPKGSLSESRAYKATIAVCKEMLELCEVINENGEHLFTPEEKPDDPRKVISFGELFSIYTVISDKVVGLLLRARKHKLVDFEGECLFQRRDDHIPIILLKPINEIREIFKEKIDAAKQALRENEELQDQLL